MATLTNAYCDLDELKRRLDISDNKDDIQLIGFINSASRAVDRYCRRRFYQNTVDEARYYKATNSCLVLTDDIVSITTLATDDSGARTYPTTWATTDYDLGPDNAVADGTPYMQLSTTPTGRYRFPLFNRGVRIVGKFGIASTSAYLPSVKEAMLQWAQRLFKLKDAPFGVAGSVALGQVTALTDIPPDVKKLLAPPIMRYRNP